MQNGWANAKAAPRSELVLQRTMSMFFTLAVLLFIPLSFLPLFSLLLLPLPLLPLLLLPLILLLLLLLLTRMKVLKEFGMFLISKKKRAVLKKQITRDRGDKIFI